MTAWTSLAFSPQAVISVTPRRVTRKELLHVAHLTHLPPSPGGGILRPPQVWHLGPNRRYSSLYRLKKGLTLLRLGKCASLSTGARLSDRCRLQLASLSG